MFFSLLQIQVLNEHEMSMHRWLCGFHFKDRKTNTKLTESLGLEPVSLSNGRSRLRWFGCHILNTSCNYPSCVDGSYVQKSGRADKAKEEETQHTS